MPRESRASGTPRPFRFYYRGLGILDRPLSRAMTAHIVTKIIRCPVGSFEGEKGRAPLSDRFGDKNTLVVYSYMFGPQRERPCPMCTSLLSAWDGEAPDILQRVALAVVARSPIERLKAFKRERGWHYLPLYQDLSGEFSRDYHALTKDGGDDAAFNVFTKSDGTIRHFWGGEMNAASADPGQDPRGAPDLMPLWTILDVTPEGRGTDWYPKLNY